MTGEEALAEALASEPLATKPTPGERNGLYFEQVRRQTDGTILEENLMLNLLPEYKLSGEVLKTQRLGNQAIPSLELTCNALRLGYESLSTRLADEDLQRFLRQYGAGAGSLGLEIQNTIVDWDHGQIIHYPTNTPIAIDFDVNQLGNWIRPESEFVQALTGLTNPGDLKKYMLAVNDQFQVSTPDKDNRRGIGHVFIGTFQRRGSAYGIQIGSRNRSPRGVLRLKWRKQ